MNRLLQDRNGQAILETALALPILLLLFAGIVHFGIRSEMRARSAMAARHGAWLGAHGRYDDIDKQVKTFFSDGKRVVLTKEKKGLEMANDTIYGKLLDLIADLLNYIPGDLTKKNVNVTVSYQPAGLTFGIPLQVGQADDHAIKFMFTSVTTRPVTAYWCDTDTWQELKIDWKKLLGSDTTEKINKGP
jgi:Flp pilus assembly protein TadG